MTVLSLRLLILTAATLCLACSSPSVPGDPRAQPDTIAIERTVTIPWTPASGETQAPLRRIRIAAIPLS